MPSDSLSRAEHLRFILQRIRDDSDIGTLRLDDELSKNLSNCLAGLNAKMSTWDRAEHELFIHPGSSRFTEDMELAEQGLQWVMIETQEVIKAVEKISGQEYLPSARTQEPVWKPHSPPNSKNAVYRRKEQTPGNVEGVGGKPKLLADSKNKLWAVGLFLLLAFITVLSGFGGLAYLLRENPYLVALVTILSIIMIVVISILALLYVHAISEQGALKVLGRVVDGLLRVDFLQAIENWLRSMARKKK